MSLTNSQYDAIMRLYNERQLNNRRELDRRRSDAYAKVPRLSELDDEVTALSLKKALFLLNEPDGSDIDLARETARIADERRSLLARAGFPEDHLEMHYTCPLCRDTGYTPDGRKCSCFRREEIRLLYSQSNLDAVLERENFDHFSLDYYDSALVNKDGISARSEAERALSLSRSFVENFPANLSKGTPENLCYYGNVGTGKTFLTHCIAHDLLEKGVSVLYMTAYDLFDKLGKYTFRTDEEMKQAHDAVFSCDLLIIDDLGTELTNSFVISQLFLLINDRLLNRKSTVISTNLSPANFRDAFTDRVFSRIYESYKLIHLSGRDIRVQKKLSGGN
ncbi:MAG: ATP-binding protein [Eubacterium sp.]|nr:ATP-binding protein [Eubacterium sp.]